MTGDLDIGALTLRDHACHRINRRMPIGPARFPFHDILWVHEGRVRLNFPEQHQGLDLSAPAGVLILPGTLFAGRLVGVYATASICHFDCGPTVPAALRGPGHLLPDAGERIHLQNLLRFAMHLARSPQPADLERRRHLLLTILDGFGGELHPASQTEETRLAMAWREAGLHLRRIRTLRDVADLLGISESTFRALHRRTLRTSAGEHLRQLRLARAEELLVTTGAPLDEIAAEVGYAHAASFVAAFRRRRGRTPGRFRQSSSPFA